MRVGCEAKPGDLPGQKAWHGECYLPEPQSRNEAGMKKWVVSGLLVSMSLACGPAKQRELPEGIDPDIQQGGVKKAADLPAACKPNDPVALQLTFDQTEASVHELITCGGIQLQLALSMKLMIFTSNKELVSASARADIEKAIATVGMSLENPFTQNQSGSWVMDAGGSSGSTFALDFYDAGDSARVKDNPFVLDSYLKGVTAVSSRTWQEMQSNPTAKTTFTYHWTDKGPLSHLLADGGEVPNPVVLNLSLIDIVGGGLGLSKPDFGPFESIAKLEMESKIHMVDDRGDVQVDYDVTGQRASVASVIDAENIVFDVDAMKGTNGDLQLIGATTGLAFLGRGKLGGEINYTSAGSVTGVIVTSDFGAGNAYGVPRWECAP